MTTTKSSKSGFVVFLIVAITLAVLVLTQKGTGAQSNRSPMMWNETRIGPIIFFAVLEGLYRDGVTNSDVDLIIPPGEDGKPKFSEDYFVYACPLCHPAFEAFRLYRHRDNFFGFKRPPNTLGKGLDAKIAGRLHSSDVGERRQAVEELISRWVKQRLEMMRLTKAEQEEITREMAEGRKQGMGGLKNAVQSGAMSQSRTNCPICDGSFGACQAPVR
jgi:hypothetical protein